MTKPRFKWRHEYDAERDELEGQLAATVNTDDSLTQQSFKDDQDINTIVKRLGIEDGPMPVAPIDPNYYGDLTNVPDLRTILDLANDARNRFMDLPAKLRARFHNEPSELWNFVQNPENAEEAVRLGLLKEPPTPETPTTSTPAEVEKKTPD